MSDFYNWDINGNPAGNSALSIPDQFSSAVASVGQNNGDIGTGFNLGDFIKMLSSNSGNSQQQQSVQPIASRIPALASGVNMQNIYAGLNNIRQQMAQPLNNNTSLAKNINSIANPYFPNLSQY